MFFIIIGNAKDDPQASLRIWRPQKKRLLIVTNSFRLVREASCIELIGKKIVAIYVLPLE